MRKFILNENILTEAKADEQKLIDFIGEEDAKRFFALKQRLKSPENDLYYWLKRDKQELLDRLDELEQTQTRAQKSAQAQEGAKLIYNQDGWKVYHITTYEASVKYGKHTQWCISGNKRWYNGEKGEQYFNDYILKGIKFYFYIKSDDEKYALALALSNNYELYNQVDDNITNSAQKYNLPNVPGLPKLHFDIPDPYIYDGTRIPDNIRKYITEIKIKDGMTRLPSLAFVQCTSLERITIPDGVTSIGNSAFFRCAKLTSITIPDSITSIGEFAFYFCSSLADVYYAGSEKDWDKIKIGAFNELLLANIHFNSRG